MADIRPFRGIRFNSERFGADLTELVCPPFDVISPDEQRALYARDAHNVVRLELPADEAGDQPGARYRRAADTFAAWQGDGVLSRDEAPALYLYRCRFRAGGEELERRGLIAALGLEEWDRGIVLPHEGVLQGAIEDRTQLMQACGANFSPIWVLYRDAREATENLWKTVQGAPDATATDREGARHELWRCSDPVAVWAFHAALDSQPVYIADGHHRYTTALQFRRDHPPSHPDHAVNFVLAHIVQADDPGLPVTGIHRLISVDGAPTADEIRKGLQEAFEIEDLDGTAGELFLRVQQASGRGRGPAFGLYAPALGLRALARSRTELVPADVAGDHSEAWRRLDAAAMHAQFVDRVFPGGTAALQQSGRLTYAYSPQEVERELETGHADLALLLAGTPVAQVLAVADARDRMPQKSTFFYPKPVTGMVLASLTGSLPTPNL